MNGFKITVDGEQLNHSLYRIDIDEKVLYSGVNGLLIDFKGLDDWSFDVWSNCKFITCDNCEFDVFNNCIFNVGDGCNLKYGRDFASQIGKANKGLHVIGEEELHSNIDSNWAILNCKHDDWFIRQVCKDILNGTLDV